MPGPSVDGAKSRVRTKEGMPAVNVLNDRLRRSQKAQKSASVDDDVTVETEDTPFPRGGGSALTPLEYKAVKQDAKEAALFGTDDVDEMELDDAGAARIGGPELVRSHVLRRKHLSSGRVDRMEVSDELRAAIVDGSIASPPDLRKLFRCGEVVCCAVLPTATRGAVPSSRGVEPPIELTMRLSHTQKAALAQTPRLHQGGLVWATRVSVEEYGCVMSTGVPAGGFMRRKPSAAPIARWRPMLCSIVAGGSQQSHKPVQLAAVEEGAPPKPMPPDCVMKFECLTPGMVFNVRVASMLADGVKVVFCGYFVGTISCEAFGLVLRDWPKRFSPGTTLTASILWIEPSRKLVALSCAAHLAAGATYVPRLVTGTAVQTTVAITCARGALLSALPDDGAVDGAPGAGADGKGGTHAGTSRKKQRLADAPSSIGNGATRSEKGGAFGAWLAQSQLVDLSPHQKSADALSALKVGSARPGVVIGVRWLDGLLEVSTRASMTGRQSWTRYEDVCVGQVLDGNIGRIDSRGARVRLSRDVYGSVNAMHLTEKQLQRPHEKFFKGQAVRCLVLESEPERQKLVLSLKPSLVDSRLPRIASLGDAKAGVSTHGVVAAMRQRSIVIRFLGGVSGIVRGSELKARFGALWESDPTSCYREGQVVECTVVSCDPDKSRLILTLLSKEEAASRPAQSLVNQTKNAAQQAQVGEGIGALTGKKRKQQAEDVDEIDGVTRLSAAEEAVAGRHSLATVVALGDHGQLLCKLDRKGLIRGRVHLTEIADCGTDIELASTLPREPLHVVVLGKRSATDGAGGSGSGSSVSLELTMRPSELRSTSARLPAARLATNELTPGQLCDGWVRDVGADGVWVCVSYMATGRIIPLEASDDPAVIEHLADHFVAGQAVTVRVVSVRNDGARQLLDLSMRHVTSKTPGKGKRTPRGRGTSLSAGAVVPVRVVRARPGRGLDVELGRAVYGRAHMTELCDEWVEQPLSAYKPGQYVRAVILSMPPDGSEDANGALSGVQVSLRPAAIAAATARPRKGVSDAHQRVQQAKDVEEGELVRGYVKAISGSGCFVSLSASVDGYVGLRHLSDDFIDADAVAKLVPVGTLVVARVLPRTKGPAQSLPLSLRRSEVEGGAFVAPSVSLDFEQLYAGQVLPGKVKSVLDFGIFVRLDGSSIDALCHKTEVADRKVGTLVEAFPVGTAVKVVVLKVNSETKKVSASMKRSRIEELEGAYESDGSRGKAEATTELADDGNDDQEEEEEDDDVEEGEESEDEDEDDDEGEEDEDDEDEDENEEEASEIDSDEEMSIIDDDEGSEEEDVYELDSENAEHAAGSSSTTRPYDEDYLAGLAASDEPDASRGAPLQGALQSASGFVWDDFTVGSEEAPPLEVLTNEPTTAETSAPRSARKARERAEERQSEAAVAAREAELVDNEIAPRTAEDFERLVLGSPNSSYAWLRYMSFQLNLTEIERARQVGERALKTIELGERKERFNVHAALLNLEKAHGDAETLATATTRALQGCDAKPVYMHVASMHERAGDGTLADAAFETAAKKFRGHPDVWIAWITALMVRAEQPAAKVVLQRAVDALPQSKHIEVISKFAQLEFRHGSAERGRTVFDGILANYPKRVDIWSVYIDMELRQAEAEPTQRLFERATSLRLSSKKMKFFFSRYLQYARSLNKPTLIAHVKDKARAWVEAAANSGAEGA